MVRSTLPSISATVRTSADHVFLEIDHAKRRSYDELQRQCAAVRSELSPRRTKVREHGKHTAVAVFALW
jgi:hypothetical protein